MDTVYIDDRSYVTDLSINFTTRAIMSSRVTCRVCPECVAYNHTVGLFTKQGREQWIDDDGWNDVMV